MSFDEKWAEAQQWEAGWWGTCANTFGEEAKQITYAHRMGLVNIGQSGGYWPLYDLAGRSVVDLGGGPVSILLKCVNIGRSAVVDPAAYPPWVGERYRQSGVGYFRQKAEDAVVVGTPGTETYTGFPRFDEAWLYNVLQHVIDPEKIVANARSLAPVVRLFEWIDLPAYQGHLHTLTEANLNAWLGKPGAVETITENGIEAGRAYYVVADGTP